MLRTSGLFYGGPASRLPGPSCRVLLPRPLSGSHLGLPSAGVPPAASFCRAPCRGPTSGLPSAGGSLPRLLPGSHLGASLRRGPLLRPSAGVPPRASLRRGMFLPGTAPSMEGSGEKWVSEGALCGVADTRHPVSVSAENNILLFSPLSGVTTFFGNLHISCAIVPGEEHAPGGGGDCTLVGFACLTLA